MKNQDKIILDLCGGTGAWSKPYKDAGYDVHLVTLPGNDVCNYEPPAGVYGILAAPPCQHFSYARSRAWIPRDMASALDIVHACINIIWRCQLNAWNAGRIDTFRFWAIENPRGYLDRFLGDAVMKFHPYCFGDLYTKETHLWGMFNPPAFTMHVGKIVSMGEYTNEAKSAVIRSITPPGFAKAFYLANR